MSRITKTGAVNCSTMAFAAVVSLLARAKVVVTLMVDSAPMNTGRLHRSLCRVTSRYSPITTEPSRFRAPLMASADQGISFMHSPPMLNSTDARNTQPAPPDRAGPCSLSFMRFPPSRIRCRFLTIIYRP